MIKRDDLCIVVFSHERVSLPRVVDAWECVVVTKVFEWEYLSGEPGCVCWVVDLMGAGDVRERKRSELRRVVSTFVGLVVVDADRVE